MSDMPGPSLEVARQMLDDAIDHDEISTAIEAGVAAYAREFVEAMGE